MGVLGFDVAIRWRLDAYRFHVFVLVEMHVFDLHVDDSSKSNWNINNSHTDIELFGVSCHHNQLFDWRTVWQFKFYSGELL